ncbi:MAG TPA: methyltransferase domain-containing protein [Actinomycetota bacterium]|nr:methyltransferase domain-containing protein [Actinomycetota bacterium]
MGAEQETRTLEWKGRTGPFPLTLTPLVFAPSSTSAVLADALEIRPGETVIDVGCGSGVLSFVAARLGAGRVYGCDASSEAVEAARANARALGLDDRVEFRAGNLLEPVRDVSADVVIGDVSGIPDPIAELTGWFPDGRSGGPTGAELPTAMLQDLGDSLAPGGRLYLPTGTIQAETRVLEVARRVFGASNLELVAQREFPLPGHIVAGSKAVARLVQQGLLSLRRRGSRMLWRLSIWRCQRP